MKDETKLKRVGHKLCMNCFKRRALYRRRGNVRWQRGFNLCFRCHRSVTNRFRLAVVASATPPMTAVELPLAA
jgi:hypothetical protein